MFPGPKVPYGFTAKHLANIYSPYIYILMSYISEYCMYIHIHTYVYVYTFVMIVCYIVIHISSCFYVLYYVFVMSVLCFCYGFCYFDRQDCRSLHSEARLGRGKAKAVASWSETAQPTAGNRQQAESPRRANSKGNIIVCPNIQIRTKYDPRVSSILVF